MSITHSLKTGEITLMAADNDAVLIGERISLLQPSSYSQKPDSTAIHLTFKIANLDQEPCLLHTDEEIGLIFSDRDALEIGLFLVAMALENRMSADLTAIREQLSELVTQMRQAETNSQSFPTHLPVV